MEVEIIDWGVVISTIVSVGLLTGIVLLIVRPFFIKKKGTRS